MGVYLAGQEYDAVALAGNDFDAGYFAGNQVLEGSSLLAVGAQLGSAISITAERTIIYRSALIAADTALVIELSSGGVPIDRQASVFRASTFPRITFSDGSTVSMQYFTSGSTSFILLGGGTAGSAIGRTLTVYRAG